eukprot:gene21753-28775_t
MGELRQRTTGKDRDESTSSAPPIDPRTSPEKPVPPPAEDLNTYALVAFFLALITCLVSIYCIVFSGFVLYLMWTKATTNWCIVTAAAINISGGVALPWSLMIISKRFQLKGANVLLKVIWFPILLLLSIAFGMYCHLQCLVIPDPKNSPFPGIIFN